MPWITRCTSAIGNASSITHNLWGYTRDLYQLPGVADTVKRDKIKAGYYGMIAHGGIIPQGPQLDFDVSHDRGALT